VLGTVVSVIDSPATSIVPSFELFTAVYYVNYALIAAAIVLMYRPAPKAFFARR
jgi:hypothetical protein